MNEIFKLGVIVSAQDMISSKLSAIADKWSSLKERFKDVTDIQGAMDKVGKAMDSIKFGSAMASASLLVLKSLPIDAARSFEKELGLLQATSDATTKEMVALKEAAIQAGMKTQFSPDQAVAGLTALASSGMNAKNSIAALLPVLDLASASAGKLSIDDAAADVAATINTFRRSAVDVTDTFTRMANISSFSIQDLGSAWKGVNAIASSMGQSMEDTALMLSAVKRAGFSTAESGEKVRMSLEALAAPSKTAQDAMNALGVSAYNQQGKFKSVIQIMDEMRAAFAKKGMGEEAQNKTLDKILLSGGGAAYRSLMALSEEERKDWMSKLENKKGATKAFAKTQQETYEGISVTLEGVLSTFKVVFGEALLPILKTLKSALIAVLTPALEFFKDHPGFVKLVMVSVVLISSLMLMKGVYMALVGVKNLVLGLTMLSTNAQFMEAASGSTLGGVMNFLGLSNLKLAASQSLTTASTMRATIATQLSAFWGRIDLVTKNAGIVAGVRYAVAETGRAIATGGAAVATKLATVAQWALNAAMAANPIGLVVAGIAVLGAAIAGLVLYIKSIPTATEKAHTAQMNAMTSERTELEKNLTKLEKQQQIYADLGDTGTQAYNTVQAKIDQTKRKISDLNDALESSNAILNQLMKTRTEYESKLDISKTVVKVAEASGDVNAIKKAKAEYADLQKTISFMNVEIQKQKDLPNDLQAVVTELNKLKTAKSTIDANNPELKGTKAYLQIEAQIKKGEESLSTLETRFMQVAAVSGKSFVETFTKGMDSEFPNLLKKVSGNNSKIMEWFNGSDAKKGPLSRVSHSGKSFLSTWVKGFESGGSSLFSSIGGVLSKAKSSFDMESIFNGNMDFKNPISMEKVLKSGESIVKTMAAGVKNSAATLYEAIKGVFSKSWKLFTQSDAKEGPFSKVGYSGKSLIRTFADGSNSEKPKLYSTIEKSFGGVNDIIHSTEDNSVIKRNSPSSPGDSSVIKRNLPSSPDNSTKSESGNSNVLNFEYFIKEFNISGKSNEGDNGFGRLLESIIYDELKRKDAA